MLLQEVSCNVNVNDIVTIFKANNALSYEKVEKHISA